MDEGLQGPYTMSKLQRLTIPQIAKLYPHRSARTHRRYMNGETTPDAAGRPKVPAPTNLAKKFTTLRKGRASLQTIADILGMDRRTMVRRLDELGIET